MVVCLVRLTCFYSCLRDWLRLISVVARDCLILVKDGKQIKRKDDCQYIFFTPFILYLAPRFKAGHVIGVK